MTLRTITAEEVRPGMVLSLPRYFERVTVTAVDDPPGWGIPGLPILVFTVDPPAFLPEMKGTTPTLAAWEGEQFTLVEEDA
jgi:hypothetical protein